MAPAFPVAAPCPQAYSHAMNWPHLHLALNHLPVFGTLFVLLLFAFALIRRNAELMRVSLWAFVILTAISVPIKYTGDYAFENLMQDPAVTDEFVRPHEKAADQATTAVFVLGVIAAVGLFLSRRGKVAPKWLLWVLLIAAIATFGLMARTANLGGRIKHPELREQPRGASATAPPRPRQTRTR